LHDALHRWGLCSLALVCALAAVAAILLLHQQRPVDGVIRLDQARFQQQTELGALPAAFGSTVRLPHDWRHAGLSGAAGWYRLELALDVAPDRLWALYVPALEMTPAAFINGTAIGGHANPDQPLPRYWNRPVLYSVPNGLLRPGVNHVDIGLQANGPWGRLSEIYLAPREAVQDSYQRRLFWRVTFLNITTVGCLMLAVFMVALSAASRDPVYLWFAAFAFAWYLQNVFFLTVSVPVSNALWDFFAYAIIGFMVSTASIFAFRFLEEPHPRWERFIWCVAAAGPLLLLATLMIADVQAFNAVGSGIWVAALLLLATPLYADDPPTATSPDAHDADPPVAGGVIGVPDGPADPDADPGADADADADPDDATRDAAADIVVRPFAARQQFVPRATDVISGDEARIIGKPSREFFQLGLKSLGLPAEQVAMVGDDIDSDVGGGQAAGLTGVLVKTGKYRADYAEESSVDPDAVLDSIADLPGWMEPNR